LTEVDAAAIVLRRPSFHELMDIDKRYFGSYRWLFLNA
jgi:hypothetical protein